MTSTRFSPTPFAYIECDVPAGQTLVAWRRERDAARSSRSRRRSWLPRIRFAT